MPSAAARSRRSVNALAMIDSVVGKITAAQVPITNRRRPGRPSCRPARPRRCQREADQADDQRGTPAEPVGQAARREHQRREGQVVAVDEPQQLAGAGVELRREAGQGDVDDRGVEVDRRARRRRPSPGSRACALVGPRKCGNVDGVNIEDAPDVTVSTLGYAANIDGVPPRQPAGRAGRDRGRRWPASPAPTGSCCARWRAGSGVSHNAAYRHFADREELLAEIARAWACAELMRGQPAAARPGDHHRSRRRARRRLAEVGAGYVDFALAEPGLFRIVFVAYPAVPGRRRRRRRRRTRYSMLNAMPRRAGRGRATWPPSGVPAPTSSAGSACTASPCCTSTGRCAAPTPRPRDAALTHLVTDIERGSAPRPVRRRMDELG